MKARHVVGVSSIAAVLAAVLLVMHFYIAGLLMAALAIVALAGLAFARRSGAACGRAGSAERPAGMRAGRERAASAAVVALVIMATVLPMGWCPLWNGEEPEHRNQYELLADSLLDGRLDLEVDVDPQLIDMDNPYDADERLALGVDYRHDHAFYNGRYYMYFGVVPVVLTFVPFKAITGASLTTYHATQLFVALLEVGLYLLMRSLRRRFFDRMGRADFLLLFAALSFTSVWFFSREPALYCTAISSGVCLEVWSLLFYGAAAWGGGSERRKTALMMVGALLGALVFGCRPPVAITGLLALPLLRERFRGRGLSPKLAGQVALVALPYAVVGALLMAYNYARFENVFEFGQSYQLTVVDQHGYGMVLDRIAQSNFLPQFFMFFVGLTPGLAFPGVFLQAPLLVAAFLSFGRRARGFLARNRLLALVVWGFATIVLTVFAQCIASPVLSVRYQFDFAWLLCLLAFVAFGAVVQTWEGTALERALWAVRVFGVHAMMASVVLFLDPYGWNVTSYYWDDIQAFLRAFAPLDLV